MLFQSQSSGMARIQGAGFKNIGLVTQQKKDQ